MATQLRFIGDLYKTNRFADVWCKDWQATLQDIVEWYPQLIPNRVIAYFDPPYWNKSPKLYERSFDPAGGYPARMNPADQAEWNTGIAHYRLAEYLRRRAQLRWILSYDDQPELMNEQWPGQDIGGRPVPDLLPSRLASCIESHHPPGRCACPRRPRARGVPKD